ncbi:sigma 54-interacting transcriptional regulator [Oscillospiraceae bacterium PP1C4]
MIKILLIIPYREVKELFKKRIQEVQDSDIQIDTTHIFGTPEDLIRECKYDIVIARGITYRALREALPDRHLVEIGMTGFDVANAIATCRRQFHPKRIAILAHDPSLNNIQQIEELCGIPIETYDVIDEHDIASKIQKARANGVEAFIGGLTLCQQCAELELNCVHIKSGEESIKQAVTQAISAAKTLNLERAKTKLMQAVLNSAHDVMISIDKEGVVTAVNNQVHQHFRIPHAKELVGCRITEFYSEDEDWRRTIATGAESETLRNFHDMLHLVNCKPIMVDHQSAGVLITIQNAEKIHETESKIRKELSAKGLMAKYYFSNIIGISDSMRNRIATAYKYSQVDSNVLLIGETGTGKELFAHSIHNASRRSQQPFVAVNCAALPENLLESELFGYVEGAFSGALKGGKMGLFELAHKGSIFLDEIGEMPISLQAKLLRVLQEKEIRRLGDDRVLPIDVRVISATNINMREKIANGQFRSDLYYRLNLLNIKIAPLRERREDIPEMVSCFVRKFARDYGKSDPSLTSEAADRLSAYSWPGNARELRNLCERLVVLNESGVIDHAEIEQLELFSEQEPAAQGGEAAVQRNEEEELLHQLLRDKIKKEDLAKMLGISRTTLWRRMNKRN